MYLCAFSALGIICLCGEMSCDVMIAEMLISTGLPNLVCSILMIPIKWVPYILLYIGIRIQIRDDEKVKQKDIKEYERKIKFEKKRLETIKRENEVAEEIRLKKIAERSEKIRVNGALKTSTSNSSYHYQPTAYSSNWSYSSYNSPDESQHDNFDDSYGADFEDVDGTCDCCD